jgi:hypothetical protein
MERDTNISYNGADDCPEGADEECLRNWEVGTIVVIVRKDDEVW